MLLPSDQSPRFPPLAGNCTFVQIKTARSRPGVRCRAEMPAIQGQVRLRLEMQVPTVRFRQRVASCSSPFQSFPRPWPYSSSSQRSGSLATNPAWCKATSGLACQRTDSINSPSCSFSVPLAYLADCSRPRSASPRQPASSSISRSPSSRISAPVTHVALVRL
jgi:hypothetical protein